MKLYTKINSRYRPATAGERIAAALESLNEIGLSEVATTLTVQMLDKVGYQIPNQVEKVVVGLREE